MISVSGKFTPQAFTLTTTCPVAGFGDATSSRTRLPGRPYSLQRTAFIWNCASLNTKDHEGITKDTKETLHHNPLYALTHVKYIEIQQITQGVLPEPEVSDDLGQMDGRQFFHCLDLYHYQFFNQEIQPVTGFDPKSVIFERQG